MQGKLGGGEGVGHGANVAVPPMNMTPDWGSLSKENGPNWAQSGFVHEKFRTPRWWAPIAAQTPETCFTDARHAFEKLELHGNCMELVADVLLVFSDHVHSMPWANSVRHSLFSTTCLLADLP